MSPALPIPAHGGDLTAIRRAHPGAAGPWLDLSTGINPACYPIGAIPVEIWRRLPDEALLAELRIAATGAYRAAGAVVPAAGTQPLLQALAALRSPGTVTVLSPTYAEHERVWRQAGHAVRAVPVLDEACGGDVVVVVNPNNPDGRRSDPEHLLRLAAGQSRRGGWLVVDEAFADLEPALSLAAHSDRPGLIVLRSLGKFFGLAGLRLSFLLAAEQLAAALRDRLGPWPVAGPAAWIGARALADRDWIAATRSRLTEQAARLDRRLAAAGLAPAGGTALFRLIDHPAVDRLQAALGANAIHVRRFAERPSWLRLGLPPEDGWPRLAGALHHFTAFSPTEPRRLDHG